MTSPRASNATKRRLPTFAVEMLRFLVVVFCAQLGYWIALLIGAPRDEAVLGLFDGPWIGVIVGAGIGYAFGGVLARSTLLAVDRASHELAGRSAEQVLAGAVGAIIGVVVGSALAWPLFLIGTPGISFPIFGFIVITCGLMGYRLGLERRDGVLTAVAGRTNLVAPSQSPATMPRIIDTSVAIDGRVLDVVRAGFLGGRMYVPQAVLGELQGLADAGDDLRRAKGRRGLEILEALRREPGVDLSTLELDVPEVPEVDGKLIRLCLDQNAALLTLDTNLARVASLAGVRVMNLHALALSLRPPVVAGDEVSVLLLKPGKEAGQAVGYLDDGTMVVVEAARDSVGHEAHVHVTSVLTTANGRMVFGRPVGASSGSGSGGSRRTG
jgi:uncharacterized protein YacL